MKSDGNGKRLVISRSVLRRTHEYFYPYFEVGVETACFWFGPEVDDIQVVTTVSVPTLFQTAGNYRVEPASWRRLIQRMRESNLRLLAQVHTHPIDYGVKHSWVDDEKGYSTANASLSLVWPDYGRDFSYQLDSLGVHEIRRGEWVLLSEADVHRRVQVVDDFADFRWNVDSGGIYEHE
jgi:hypothetical protein